VAVDGSDVCITLECRMSSIVQRAVVLYGLPPYFTTQDLRGLLRRFGAVQDVRLSPHNKSSLVLGYGEMTSQEQAEQAVKQLHGTMLLGHKLIVHRSTLVGF
jgi:RNA recognition motif-containing protein